MKVFLGHTMALKHSSMSVLATFTHHAVYCTQQPLLVPQHPDDKLGPLLANLYCQPNKVITLTTVKYYTINNNTFFFATIDKVFYKGHKIKYFVNCCEKEGIIIYSLILRATGCKTL
jgi:hypothetical protein